MATTKTALKNELRSLGIKTYRNKVTGEVFVKKGDVKRVLADKNDVSFETSLSNQDFKNADELYTKLELVMTEQNQDDWEIDVEIVGAVIPGSYDTRTQPGEPTHLEGAAILYKSIELDFDDLTERTQEILEIEAIEIWKDAQEPDDHRDY